jgi:imidazolonepropionase-like amidohydrolase
VSSFASLIATIAVLLLGIRGHQEQTPRLTREPTHTAFVDVNVVPMTGPRVLEHQTVLIAGDHIERIGNAGTNQLPVGTRVIRATGQYLMPGLIDMHIHVRDTTDFALYVANGVTTVRILRGTPRHVFWRRRIADGEMFGPRIFTSGPFTNLPEIRNPADALRTAVEQKATGYDFIKIHGSLPRDAYDTLVAAGRRLGIPVVGHAPRNLPFDAVLHARQTDISHLEEFVYTYFARDVSETAAARIPSLAHALRDQGMAVTTTLVAYDRIGRQVDSLELLLAEPQNKYVAPGQRASWDRENNDYLLRFSKSDVPVLRARYAFLKKLLKAFVDSGVTVMLGTDAVGETWVPGWTVHEELQNFVSAGLSPYESLRAATALPAKFLDSLQTFGVVQQGKRADLLLLRGNPLADVKNAQAVAGVMVRGKWYPETSLRGLLAAVDSANRAEERRVAKLLTGGIYSAVTATCGSSSSYSSDEKLLVTLQVTSETARIALRGDTESAEQLASRIRTACSDATIFDESKLNNVGMRLVLEGRLPDAIKAYALSEKEFSRSFLAPYFLGEALLKAGDTTRALAAYRRSVVNDPQMMDAIQRIQQLSPVR